MMSDIAETGPLIFGFSFDADGKATPLNWDAIKSGKAESSGARIWLHLNRLDAEAQIWLRTKSGLDPIICHALLQEDTRPRATRHGDGLLFNFRAVNLNEGADPEDMLALRGWATKKIVITLRAHMIRAVNDIRTRILEGNSPRSTGDLITALSGKITDRIEPIVAELEEQADEIEEKMLEGDARLIKTTIGEHRRTVLKLRRYIIPQREALSQAIREGANLFADDQMLLMRETSDRVTRITEELDSIRERLIVLQEQMVEERGERMNQRLFVLAILSAIFLPLSFVTGLFGVNVGGMPGVESGLAFAILCASMVGLTGLLILVLHKMDWL